MFYLSTIAIIFLPFGFILLDDRALYISHLKILFFSTLYLSVIFISNHTLSYYYSIPYIFISVFIIIDKYKISIGQLLKIHNIIFVIYVFLSFLVYVGIITLERDLNIFEEQGLFFNIRTFVGFYGSTASIDSYAMFTFLVNFLLNKRKWSKTVMLCLALISSLSTLRFTPVVALMLAFVVYQIIKYLSQKGFSSTFLVFFANLIVVFSFLFVFLITPLFSENIELLLQAATHGRFSIWENMILKFSTGDFTWLQKLFGMGKPIPIDTQWMSQGVNITENTHNSFLDIMIKFGYLGIAIFYLGTSYMMSKFRRPIFYFISLFIIFTAITNTSTFSYSFPIYMFWIYAFYKYPSYENHSSIFTGGSGMYYKLKNRSILING